MGGMPMPKSKPKLTGKDLANEHRNSIVKLINQVAYNKSAREVFNDFVEMAALALANAIPHADRANKEKRYLEIINSYNNTHQVLLVEMFKELVSALDAHVRTGGPEDVLGSIYSELGINNSRNKQNFSPQNIADLMASIVFDEDKLSEVIKQQGFTYVKEFTCGSGVMIMGVCRAMIRNGFSYNAQLLVEALDIDIRCVQMTYVQLCLYGVPAVVIHGDALSLTEWSRWYTPFYFLDGWYVKRKAMKKQASETI